MKIKDNSVVSMHYTLKNDNGDILDTSDGREVLKFLQGAHNIIIGLEKALDGKEAGEKLEVTVEPEEAYGVKQLHLIQQVPRTSFEGVETIEVGMQFHAQTENGPVPVTITAINDDSITVDGNHALAGERLHFSVSIEEVREATAEEIDHGHVH